MERIVRKIFWIMATIAIIVVSLAKLADIVMKKDAYGKNIEFMQRGREYDVLFLGTSHMMEAALPMELWREYGIASYNLAGNAHTLPTTYWVMMNALDYASPELVVVDCFKMESDSKESSMNFAHQSFDSLPLSKNKVRAICDIYDTAEKRVEYLWNFSLYHARWNSVGPDDFEPQAKLEKGAFFGNIVAEPNTTERVGESNMHQVDSVGADYLRKIIEECQKRGIEVLLTFIPFPATVQDQVTAGYVQKLAEEYDVDYINFLNMDVVNYETDCNDANSHLNVSGAGKVTDYLGAYIREHYNIADHQFDEVADQWNEDYGNYLAYKIDRIAGVESLKNCLMMLSDPNISCCVYVSDNSGLWKSDKIYEELFQNIVGKRELFKLREAVQKDEAYCLIVDREEKSITECIGIEEAVEDTSFGRVAYDSEEGGQALYIGEQNYLALQEETDGLPTVTVVVINDLNKFPAYIGKFYNEYRVSGEN